ncbi:dicarboxylate/amino acid:cation symporter [Desulfobulbus sp.]|uniref:dicarboxylate/amino acid:cation symporter n=1 Tax=Desulfobulbus sp. TaxID=895 RepID=UPI0027B96296|nr:cation:dicarboxylase symporter family transporter [Desulfobulbus sp.]
MTRATGRYEKVASLLRSSWSILFGVGAGIVLGMVNPKLSVQIAPIGDLYLTLLTMCVIPIMITAVVSSFGRLLSSPEAAKYLKRIGVVFTCGIIAVTAVGMVVALIGSPGAGLGAEMRAALGAVLLQADKTSATTTALLPATTGWAEFMKMLIPANIFGALSEGKNLQILFFSLVFGLAMGLVPSESRSQFLDLTEVVFKAFEKLIGIAMYFLPFGLFSMIAGQVAGTGVEILLAMGRYVVIVHVAVVLLLMGGGLIISKVSRKSFFKTFSELREPLMVAFGTRNSYAAMPSMLNTLHHNYRLPPDIINLVVPLSVVICRYSMILVFTIGAVFVAQLYGIPLGIPQLGIIFGGTLLGMLAGAGAPGVVALAMVSMVLIPLGLPVETAIILLLAVNFLIDPALTILNVHLTCVAAVVIGRKNRPHGKPGEVLSAGDVIG